MNYYYHYYEVIYTLEETVFNREVASTEFCTLPIQYESIEDALLAAAVIRSAVVDVKRVVVLYNVMKTNETEPDELIDSTIVSDFVKDSEDSWSDNVDEFAKDTNNKLYS